MRNLSITYCIILVLALFAAVPKSTSQIFHVIPDSVRYIDDSRDMFVVGQDTVRLRFTDKTEQHRGPLTERDFEEFAAELGVEVPAIKAVVEIEAGRSHKGFWSEGKPLLNFDLVVFKQMAARHKVGLSKHAATHPEVFARPNLKRYGSQQAAVQARFDGAAKIDSVSAIEGTFWGMFQIGGFNWRQCGTNSPQEFYRLMSRSERDQLELFGEFITRTGLLPALKAKNWAAFARGYNGASYASRGYHTRLSAAYHRYKASGKR